jgi:hypothetical protein
VQDLRVLLGQGSRQQQDRDALHYDLKNAGCQHGLHRKDDALPAFRVCSISDSGTAFIASCTSDQRDLEAESLFTPLTYLGPDGQIGIVLVAGEALECDSYSKIDTE